MSFSSPTLRPWPYLQVRLNEMYFSGDREIPCSVELKKTDISVFVQAVTKGTQLP